MVPLGLKSLFDMVGLYELPSWGGGASAQFASLCQQRGVGEGSQLEIVVNNRVMHLNICIADWFNIYIASWLLPSIWHKFPLWLIMIIFLFGFFQERFLLSLLCCSLLRYVHLTIATLKHFLHLNISYFLNKVSDLCSTFRFVKKGLFQFRKRLNRHCLTVVKEKYNYLICKRHL